MNVKNEPVVTASGVVGAIEAVLVALVTLGVFDLDEPQVAAIVAAFAAVVPIVGALIARRAVTPNGKVEQVAEIRASQMVAHRDMRERMGR